MAQLVPSTVFPQQPEIATPVTPAAPTVEDRIAALEKGHKDHASMIEKIKSVFRKKIANVEL